MDLQEVAVYAAGFLFLGEYLRANTRGFLNASLAILEDGPRGGREYERKWENRWRSGFSGKLEYHLGYMGRHAAYRLMDNSNKNH